jgi:hypothetical protein
MEKEMELWSLPLIEDSYGKKKCLLLWPRYIGEKGRTLGKAYGIKARCYWEHPWGTNRELVGNKGKN